MGEPDLRYKRHRIVTATTLQNRQDELFCLPTAVFYSDDNAKIDSLYEFATKEFDRFCLSYPILHIIPHNAELQSLGGLMRDKVNGTCLDIDDLIDKLSTKKSQIFFR